MEYCILLNVLINYLKKGNAQMNDLTLLLKDEKDKLETFFQTIGLFMQSQNALNDIFVEENCQLTQRVEDLEKALKEISDERRTT